MFDRSHLLYICISTFVIIFLLWISNRFIKEQKDKDRILKFSAVITVIIHYSSLYVEYFSVGSAMVDNTMLFPIYPCNIAMWLLLIVSFMKNRRGRVYNILSEFTFYLGITGGVIGILFNEIYISNPNLSDWNVLKGLLSHSTMLFGCIYLLVGNYIKIRCTNVFSVFIGLLLLLTDGILVISLYRLFNMDAPNIMYLLENPFPQIPWFNTLVIGVLGLVIVSMITIIYEQVTLAEENRWYTKIKDSKERNKI